MRHSLALAGVLGVIHAVIDASTVTMIFSVVVIHDVQLTSAFALVLGYDLIAFAGQPILGIVADKVGNMRAVIIAGILLTGASLGLMLVSPVAACVVGGVGNALFHLGAGAVCIYIKKGRAAATGVFVGPGAIGLAFGSWFGKSGMVMIWPFMAVLGAALVVSALIALPRTHGFEDAKPGIVDKKLARPWLGLALVMSSIFFRSLVGHAGSHACPKIPQVLFGLAVAACLGKMLGGLLSDRFGWIRTSTVALLASMPFLAFGGDNPLLVGIGLMLFQMTMAVTLVAIAMVFPKYPAFAFGLNCLAFILGAIPTFYPPLHGFYGASSFSLVIAVSIVTVFLGLSSLRDGLVMRYDRS
jgi:FSR family fosmidomycin resistance protein-like MFS transporter